MLFVIIIGVLFLGLLALIDARLKKQLENQEKIIDRLDILLDRDSERRYGQDVNY